MKRFAYLGLLALASLIVTAMFAPRPAAAAESSGRSLIIYRGEFDLFQADGPNCNYSAAPFTTGTYELGYDWDASNGRIIMEGSGQAYRYDLRCDDFTADMFWTQTYDVEASGDVDYGSGTFSWQGTLKGFGSSEYLNCEQDGEPAPCPPPNEGPYQFPVLVSGQLNCAAESGGGSIEVLNIGLPTSGSWTNNTVKISGPSIQVQDGRLTINGRFVPSGCRVPLAIGDETKIEQPEREGDGTLRVLCNDLAEDYMTGSFSGPDARFFLLYLLGQSCPPLPPAPLSLQATEPDFKLELENGSVNLASRSDALTIALETAEFGARTEGQGRVVVRRSAANGNSELSVLAGTASVAPASDPAAEVTVGAGEYVTAAGGSLGPVQALFQNNLPYLARPSQ